MRRLILASTSPRRRELLTALGLSFGMARPDIDETPLPDEPADAYVARLSREKALALPPAALDPGALVITADTTVVQSGEIIGKPADAAEAVAMLRRLRDQPHLVHTGLTVRDMVTAAITTLVTTTQVFMRPYADAEIDAYVASGEPYDKAGGYAIQDGSFQPVERLEGCYTNVMGLPVCVVCAVLEQCGVPVPRSPVCSTRNLPCRWPGAP